MLTQLFLVRHAHSVYTPDELGRPLSPDGFIDAEKIIELLEKENIAIVLSSPYKRAIQTVEGVAKSIGQEVILKDDFKERKLAAQSVADFDTAISKVWEDPTFSFEGGESNVIAQKRGVNAVIKVLEAYEGKNIVIGTHGNLMALIMNHFNPDYDFNFWKSLDMPDIYKLTFKGKTLLDVNQVWHRD